MAKPQHSRKKVVMNRWRPMLEYSDKHIPPLNGSSCIHYLAFYLDRKEAEMNSLAECHSPAIRRAIPAIRYYYPIMFELTKRDPVKTESLLDILCKIYLSWEYSIHQVHEMRPFAHEDKLS